MKIEGYRLKQVQRLLYKDLIDNWDKATVLPLEMREELKKSLPLKIDYKIFEDKNTKKAVINLKDNSKIETVLMEHDNKRATVCVSCQVGCPLGCLFCATGTSFKRNLEVDEILQQVLLFSRYYRKPTNIVFMGMGEPFLNYENVMQAIKILNDPNCFNIGARKISISTAGVIDGIKKFTNEDNQVNLSISLHAPSDELRRKLMPVSNGYTIKELLEVVDDYILKTKRRVMFEYLLIKDINDSMEHAKQLSQLMKRPLYMVNLIPYNSTGKFKRSLNTKEFKDYLEKQGIFTTQRYEFGHKIDAACGQLANRI